MPGDAADLIKNLLQRNPYDRIGGGEKGRYNLMWNLLKETILL